ncbi:MAG: CehA/McbA family metallohydrolase [Verrucomicrobiae bacterium]|nr:CehA/McbA family metallohydrolase [Verrucomicrobiae bacterium]
MNLSHFLQKPCLIGIGLFLTASSSLLATPVVIDSDFHHLRNAEPREWSSFPKMAESDRLKLTFDLESPDEFKLLTLRQQETKQAWAIRLNGTQIGALPRDHNHLEYAVAIPPRLLKESANVLEIATDSEIPDDIRVGAVALHRDAESPVDDEQAALLSKQRGYQRLLPKMTATVKLSAVEANTGDALPCRFTIVDAESGALVFIGAESDDRLAVREGIIYSLDGEATIRLAGDSERPRRYLVYCGRGFEYSMGREEIVIDASDDTAELSFQLRQEVPTPGLVACDTHLHTFQFDRHGDCTLIERLLSAAGEGIELPISTAHDQHIDYAIEAARIGASKWMTPVLGCEVTTHFGHFNTFPVEPGSQPAEHKLRPWDQIFANIYATPGVKICILNHGRDAHRGFTPLHPDNFNVETGTFTLGRKLRANAMELINSGAQQTDPMQIVHDWFALLKSGHQIAGVGSSDSHTVNFAIAGQARTYVACPDDDSPANLDINAVVDSFLTGKTWVSFGLLTQLDLDPESDSVTVRVLGPSWTRADRVRLFRNGEEVQSIKIPETIGSKPGEKFTQTFALADLGAKSGDFLCAVATGPGITEPWWAIMPPYQPTSPDFAPFVMGISPALWLKQP